MHATGQALEGEETTPLAIAGAMALWLLRLALAPASTLTGFRRWTVEECPSSGRKAPTLLPRHRPRCRRQNCPRSRQAGAAVTASRTSRTC